MAVPQKARKQAQEKKPVSARNRAENHRSGGELSSLRLPEGAQLFQLKKPGTYRIDIIPYILQKNHKNPYANQAGLGEGDAHFEHTFYVHRNIGPENETFVCPRKTYKKPCPICDYRARLSSDPSSDEDLIRDLAPKERQLFNVIDLANPEKGIQIFESSYHLFGKLLDAKVRGADEDDNYEYFADPEQGFTLKLVVEEDSFGKITFCKTTDVEFKTRKKQYEPDIMEQAFVLDTIPKEVDAAKLKEIFLQSESDSADDDDDDDDKPKKKNTKPVQKPVTKKNDDDDDDDDTAFKVKSRIKFSYKGKVIAGVITAVDHKKELLTVKDEKTGKLHYLGFDDETIVVLNEAPDDDDDDDDDDDPKPTSKKKKPTSNKADDDDDDGEADDDDDDDDDDDADDDDDDGEADDDDDDDDADDDDGDDDDDDDEADPWDDEEEEEEEPKPKAKKGKK